MPPETINPNVAPPPDPPIGPGIAAGPPNLEQPPAAPAPTEPQQPQQPQQPQPAPTGEPAQPAQPQPAGMYPVATPPDESRSHVAETVWRGERVQMTQDELDRLAYVGLNYLEQVQQQQQPSQPQVPGAATPAQPQPQPGAPAQVDPRDQQIQRLGQELLSLKQQFDTNVYTQQVNTLTDQLNQRVDQEMTKHKVFTDNPEIQATARKAVMATLNHNPRMTEAQAATAVANEFGATFNRQREHWIKGKVNAAQGAEVPPGGAATGTPPPQALKGVDLMKGRVAQQALARTRDIQLIT